MIKTRAELNRILKLESEAYRKNKKKSIIIDILTSEPNVVIWKYQKLLRQTEFYYNNKTNPLCALLYLWKRWRKNRLGLRLGIEIWENSFDEGLIIYHAGNIVVNGKARIGKNCRLHGDNCIGNLGGDGEAPNIGDNVDIGVGAKIIGDIVLASDVKIGAGAVVVKSCGRQNTTLVGVPAHPTEWGIKYEN